MARSKSRTVSSEGKNSAQAHSKKKTAPKAISSRRQLPPRRVAVQARLERKQADMQSGSVKQDEEMQITSGELGQIFLDNTIGLYEGFLPRYTVAGPLNSFVRSEDGSEIQSTVEELGSDSWLDVELVYFGLRKLVQENLSADHIVHVIPTLTPLLLKSNAEELINKKISLDKEKYKDIILLPVKDVPDDSPIHAENDHRSQLISQKREEILFLNNLSSAEFIKIYLTKMADELALDYEQDQQLIIPMRVGQNHYTVAVVQIQDQTASIVYKDSFNQDCPDGMKQPIVDYFSEQLGAANVSFKKAKSQKQRNSYDCGVFTILNGLDMVRQNVGLPTSLPTQIDQDYLLMYRGFLFCLFQSLGLQIKLETGMHKLLNQKMNQVFEHSQDAFKRQQKKQPLQEQAKLLIDLIHNPENGLSEMTANNVKSAKARVASINQGELSEVIAELQDLGEELKKITHHVAGAETIDFITEQVKQTEGLLNDAPWLMNPVISAVKKAAALTVGIIAVGITMAKFSFTLTLSSLLASQSIFVPVAATLFSASVYFTIKLSNWLSDDSKEKTTEDFMAGTSCCNVSASGVDEHEQLLSREVVSPVVPAFDIVKQEQKQSSTEKQATLEISNAGLMSLKSR